MNEEPKSLWQKSWPAPRWLRVWLILFAITLPIALISFLLTANNVSGWEQWLGALLFVFIFSLVITTVIFGLWRLLRWLCCWRNLRRALFTLVCAATVIALFYAEENWRGQHAWNQFRRAQEAKGEHFDLASHVPPPVPDAQNFALAPIVVSSYGQMIDHDGHEIRPRNTNLINRLSMNYGDGNDYPTNGTGDWIRGTRIDFKGFQEFYRVLSAKTNLFPVPPVPQSPAADVLIALSRFDGPIEELRAAARLPQSRFPLEYDKEDPAEILLPHLAALKTADRILQLRALAELQTGRSEQALADLQLMGRLAESIRTEPFVISHLVRIAMLQIMLQPVWEGLADHRWNDAQLATLDGELARPDFIADYQRVIRAEKAFQSRLIDYLRQHPQRLSILTVFDNAREKTRADAVAELLVQGHLIPTGWFYQNQLVCLKSEADFLVPAVDVKTRTFLPKLGRQREDFLKQEQQAPMVFNYLLGKTMPWLGNTPRRFAHAQNSADLARVAIALERYRLAQGKFPGTLDALVPEFLNSLPADVIGGQPLHYRLKDDGQFLLYSVGWNEKDDGGVVNLKLESIFGGLDFDDGDWVWSYPAK